jgi:DUF1365 family protein
MNVNSALYIGEVEHRRLTPKENIFRYKVCYYFLELSEVPKLFNWPIFLSYNRPALLSFWRKDYIGDKKIPIEQVIRDLIFQETQQRSLGPIRLLTNISYFGFCFNPVSFYYCYSEDGKELEYIVSEITNTPWGEKHRQVFSFDGSKLKKVYQFAKDFHVSPFIPMNIDYTWIFQKPEEVLYVHMQNRHRGEAKVFFDTTLDLKRYSFTRQNIIKAFILYPLVTYKTMFAIYYQALKLYIKKTPFYTHPAKEKVI